MFYRLHHSFLVSALAMTVALVLAVGVQPAFAQQKKADPAVTKADTAAGTTINADALQKLVKTIEDDAARKQFLERLKALIAADAATRKKATEGPGFLERLALRARKLTDGLGDLSEVVSDLPKAWTWLNNRLTSETQRELLVAGIWKSVLAILLGLLAEFLLRWLLRGPRQRVEDREREVLPVRAGFLALRTMLDLLPIAAFAAAAYAILPQLNPSVASSRVALTLIFGFILVRSILAVFRAILAPRAGSLRLLPLKDGTAAYLYVWVRRLTNTAVYGYFGLQALAVFNLPIAAYDAILRLLGVIVLVMTIVFILQNRKAVAAWFRGGPERSRMRRAVGRLGDIWHVVAIAYVLAGFFVWLLDVDGGFVFMARATLMTVLIALVAGLAMFAIRRLLDRLFRIEDDLREKNPELQERANRYLPVVRRVLFSAITVIAFLAVLQVWGFGVIDLLETPAGRSFVESVVTIVLVIVGAIILWELINTSADRYLARLEAGGAGPRAVRMRTLLPMVEKGLMVAIVVAASLIVLSEVGLNIGPLLAGAGVLGLAIGFGAQTLVKDVITGIFNIIEDTMAIGDVVTVASRTGVVEDLSIRSVTLRDYSGVQHTIPFSSISDVQNMTKDYSYALLDYGVGYRENVDEVIAVIREVGAALKADGNFGINIISDLEVAGLHELGDSAVVIRSRLKCKPGFQWGVKREMNRRIKAAFDERNIEIPFPHTTVYFGEDKDGQAPSLPVRMMEDAVKQDIESAAEDGKTQTESNQQRAQKNKDALDPALDNE